MPIEFSELEIGTTHADRRLGASKIVGRVKPRLISRVSDKAAEAAGISTGVGPKQLIVVGGNCLKEGLAAIAAGKMYSSVTQIPTDLGRRTADVANEVFEGKQLPKAVLLPAELITKANLARWETPCTY